MELTTAIFTIWTGSPSQVVSGVKVIFDNSSSGNVVNFTTGMDGKATLRWLTTNSNYNYSLSVTFYGLSKQIGLEYGTYSDSLELEITAASSFDIYMDMGTTVIEDFETMIELLMSNSIREPWGTDITLRALFNVTEVGETPFPKGPAYADLMSYKIYDPQNILVKSGTISKESNYIGRHKCTFETSGLEANIIYSIIIEASKAEYVAPLERSITLILDENMIMLNQSVNDNSEQSVYWLENLNMSVIPYGEMTEEYTIEQSIFQSDDHDFKFSIPDVTSSWNISEITFNIYNITWTGAENDINITITDPYGIFTKYTRNNHSGWDIAGHKWTGITYIFNKGSPNDDNNFNFTIGGSFAGYIDIITNIYFIRDKIKVQYSQFNTTDTISLLSDGSGWVIKNIVGFALAKPIFFMQDVISYF